MATIERAARPAAARRDQAQATQRDLRWGALWVSSFRGDSLHDLHSSVRPEEAARGVQFYNSTCFWV
jgi:predicted dithiol-disulfide oxidoreductase (DUF899 family)